MVVSLSWSRPKDELLFTWNKKIKKIGTNLDVKVIYVGWSPQNLWEWTTLLYMYTYYSDFQIE